MRGVIDIEVSFTKEDTLKLIEEYYSRLEGRQVKASASAKKGYTGWHDEEACVTTIAISEKMEFVGMSKEVKETITEDQLNTMLKALFDLYEFDLTSLSLDDGLSSKWVGYGMSEHEEKTAFFKGITVNVKKKKNQSLEKRPKGS